MIGRLKAALGAIWKTLLATFHIYSKISGEQLAAAFAYYALFSMFPLVALLLAVGSFFFNPEEVHSAIQQFVPISDQLTEFIFSTVKEMEDARGGVSLISFFVLMWTSLRFFQALVRGVNAAWETEAIPWWQMPVKNLIMIAVIGSALALGVLAPAVIQGIRQAVLALSGYLTQHFPRIDLQGIVDAVNLSRYLVSALVLFYAFTMLYMLAPRRKVLFSEVWLAGLIVTILLQLLQVAFVNILPRFINYSAVYGSIGTLMLLLFWIYITGQIIIIGGCLSVARAREIEAASGRIPAPQ